MKVFFADASPFGNGRLLNLVSDLKGIEVSGHATDGLNAIALVQAVKPEVLILDIEMPGRSGLDLLRQVRRDFSSLVIVILTNASSAQYRKRCTELGADFFFDKSTEFRKVPGILEQLVKKHSLGLPLRG